MGRYALVVNFKLFHDELFKKRFYLFTFREGKGGRKRGRERSTCGCLLSAPYWGHGPQPRRMPWLGIGPAATLRFAGLNSIHWATQTRAPWWTFYQCPCLQKYQSICRIQELLSIHLCKDQDSWEYPFCLTSFLFFSFLLETTCLIVTGKTLREVTG